MMFEIGQMVFSPDNSEDAMSVRADSRADLILQLDPAIRQVAIIENTNKVIECKSDTSSLPLSPETLKDFASIGPLLVLGSMGSKLKSSCGRLSYVTGRFENALVTIYQLPNHMVVVVMDKIVQNRRLEEIASLLKQIW